MRCWKTWIKATILYGASFAALLVALLLALCFRRRVG